MKHETIPGATGAAVNARLRAEGTEPVKPPYLRIENVWKSFGDFVALKDISLSIGEGEFVCFLGPSGCGKTTLLRAVAGLDLQTRGIIHQGGRDISVLPPSQRDYGIVFQSYALFPNLTIERNVAFGLENTRRSKAEIAQRVAELLDLVGLASQAKKYPAQLSGGQQQRIALARSIVIEPDVLLLDEPLSALDANLREDMRVELKRIQSQLGITTVFVTHDQSEALAMSDRIVVMSAGHVEQVGAPEDVYTAPSSAFVARFLGNANLMPCKVVARDGQSVAVDVEGLGPLRIPAARGRDMQPGASAMVVIRAERLRLTADAGALPDDALALPGEVTAVDYQGQAARYFVTVSGRNMQALNPIEERPFRQGETVQAVVRGRDCALVAAEA